MPAKRKASSESSTATIGGRGRFPTAHQKGSALIEAGLVDTALRGSAFPQSEAILQVVSEAKDNMVALPGQHFYSTQIPS